ncbi:unnamed protein product [Rotaria socialis]|nr:unnamed protein product [Rotaria socialis]
MDEANVEDGRRKPSIHANDWNESLCGCFSDLKICCCGWCCLPCLFGDNAEKIDGSSCVGMCLAYWLLAHCDLCWVPHLMKRKKLREKFHFKEDTAVDCLVTAFCAPCAVCQEARELKLRAGPLGNANVAPVRRQPTVAYRK